MGSRAEDQEMTMETGLAELERVELPTTIGGLQLQATGYGTALRDVLR